MAYVAGDTLIRVVMTAKSGLVADQVVNDFAFKNQSGSATIGDAAGMIGMVSDFYSEPSAGNRISNYIGENVDRAATHQMEAYHIVAGPLGSPFYTEDWIGPAAPGTANSNLPLEVAAVLSFHADLTGIQEEAGATRPRARRRGRVYLGPLTTDGVTITDDAPLLGPDLRTAMGAAAVALKDAAETDWPWCVWSRADAILRPVVGGWTDNAPDTQRRRGQESTNRATWA